MKKIMVALLMAALIGGGAFAGEGFGVTAQVEGNLFTTTAGESGTTDAGFFTGLNKGAGDFELAFSYDDADGLYGAKLKFEAGGDAKSDVKVYGGALVPVIGTAWAYVNFGGLVKVTAGKDISYRAASKVGGDKDFGVLGVDYDSDKAADVATGHEQGAQDAGKNIGFTSTDPFKFGDGLVVNVLVGPLDIGLFAGPSQGIKVWNQDKPLFNSGVPDVKDKPLWDGSLQFNETLDKFNYQYGVSVAFKHEIVDAGLAFKMTRANGKSMAPIKGEWTTDPVAGDIIGYTKDGTPIYKTDGTGVWSTSGVTEGDWGIQSYDWGLYGTIKAVPNLTIGVGYAGHKDYVDEKDDAGKYDSPITTGINLDAKYVLGNLTAGLYNNISLWSQPEETGKQREQSYFFLFDELNVAYKVTEKLTADVRARNYLSTYTMKMDSTSQAVTVDRLAIRAGVEYQVAPSAKGWARLQFENTAYSSDPTTDGWDKVSAAGASKETSRDHFTFSIPVGIQVKF
jgi:hypothetical protein